jgi:phosphate transport system substrate-binding protein
MRFRPPFLAAAVVTASLAACVVAATPSAAPEKVRPVGATEATSFPAATNLKGSGSTFIKPIMDKWVAEYAKKNNNVTINYQGAGSGAGINQMTDKAVDFGCTDAVMKKEQLDKAKEAGGEVLHIPLVLGAIVPAYNVPGVTDLNLSGEVLAQIYLGKITKWDDDKIKADNKDAKLPNMDILVVTRADSSGSTNIFTDFLSKVSPDFRETVGVGTTVKWPKGIKGSSEPQTSGVAGFVAKNAGAIGYIELFYALQNKISYAAVKNHEGKFVKANLESITKAADNSLKTIRDDLRFSLTNAAGAESYPISGATWAVLYTKPPDDHGKEVTAFLAWATHDGQKYCKDLDYAPLPKGLVEKIDEKLKTIK